MQADLAKVKELFLAVLELPATEREAYLDTACAGDNALRRRLDAMLQSQQNSGELLPRPPAAMLADNGGTETDGTAAFAAQPDPSATKSEWAAGESNDLSFLSPSETPEHLGRLGHYEVQETIGRGGFGIVLKAFDERLHRVVAIKVLSPAYAANGAARKRFIREARTAAAVKNDHVVAIYGVEDEAQPPYLVMEIIDGISLQDKLDKKGPLSVKEILRIGLQTAEGLAAAHKQGLVHRDIKPANILLENGVERVKITDFGLARAVDDASVTQSGTVAGTPMYMSPEQAEGLPVDHRSDLFSLGSVLYVMCTGHPPFRASGTHAVLKRVIDASPRPIREVNPEIPDWLIAIIAKLHAKKLEDRIQTANEVAEVLGQHLSDLQAGRTGNVTTRSKAPETMAAPAAAAPTPVADVPGLVKKKRWPRLVAAAALVFVIVSAIGGYLAYQRHPETPINEAVVTLGGPHDPIGLEKVVIRSVDIVDEKVHRNGLHFAELRQEPSFIKEKTVSRVSLPPGKYEIEVICKPGYVLGKCELSRENPGLNFFGKMNPLLIDLEPGDKVLLQLAIEKADTPPLAVAPFDAKHARQHQDAWAKHLGVAVEIENLIGMKLRLIPPGKFLMGASPSEPGITGDEYPQHQVTLTRPFYAGAHEVTVGQFKAFVKEMNYKTDAEQGAGASAFPGPGLMWDKDANWKNMGFVQADDHPIVCVTLNDAKAFCNWLSKKEGRTYTIPSEAQWEYCCRAGMQTPFSFGNDILLMGRHGWFERNSQMKTHPVGAKEPNAWGLFDMHGNASEWTADWIGHYPEVAQRDPIGPASGSQHSFRGGAFTSPADFCRSSMRELGNGVDGASAGIGFRVLLVGDLEPPPPPEEPGWVRLFNGRDLTGWGWDAQRNPSPWRVAGRELICPDGGSTLATVLKYSGDVHLRADLQLSDKSQVGFSYGNPAFTATIGIDGDNIWVSYSTGREGNRQTELRLGLAGTKIRLEILGEWGSIEVKVNGRTMIQGQVFKPQEPYRAGPITLSTSDGKVRFSRIEIKELGPIRLWNGRDLNDWQGDVKSWRVDNEAGTLGGFGTIVTKKAFENYELRLQYLRPNYNQDRQEAILLHSDGNADGQRVELDITGTNGSELFRFKSARTGMVIGPAKTGKAGAGWSDLRIVSRNGKLEAYVDGEVRASLPAGAPSKGFIGLSLAGSIMKFRNIEIKELPAEEPGWTPLFNGKNLEGWGGGKKVWQADEYGSLVFKGPEYEPLQTTKTFTDFCLRFDYKYLQQLPNANMGFLNVELRGRALPDWKKAYPLVEFKPEFGDKVWVRRKPAERGDNAYESAALEQRDGFEGKGFRPGDWDSAEIRCVGETVEVLSHGVSVGKAQVGKARTGPILLQPYNAGMAFRNIEIRELLPPAGAWTPLFNGKDLTGWTATKYKCWHAKDAQLIAEIPDLAFDYLERIHPGSDHFHLRFEGKLGPDSNMSLFFHVPGKGHGVTLTNKWVGLWRGDKKLARVDKPLAAPDQWFHLDLIAEGPKIRILMNGESQIEYTDPDWQQPDVGEPLMIRCAREANKLGKLTIKKIELKELRPGFVPFTHGATIAGWGQVVDPTGKCHVARMADELAINVPAGKYQLTLENMDAPRVLREVKGDFTAQVAVLPFYRPGANEEWVGTGLVVWKDRDHFVRFALLSYEAEVHVLSVGLYHQGKLKAHKQIDFADKEKLPIWLRVEKRDGRLRFVYSTDAKKWHDAPIAADDAWPGELKVGVYASNSTTAAYWGRYRNLEIKEPGAAAK